MSRTSLDVATEDEKTCRFLHEDGGNDCERWVITSAFYSALHMTDHFLFPITVSDENGDEFEYDRFAGWYEDWSDGFNKHLARKRLFRRKARHFPGGQAAARTFDKMLQDAMTSRYSLETPGLYAPGQAIVKLELVRDFCLKHASAAYTDCP